MAQTTMKKKRLMTIMFCTGFFAVALLLTSCGGSGGETEGGKTEANFKKSPKNEFLGDLVNIAGEYSAKFKANDAEFKEAKQKNKEKYGESDKGEENYAKLNTKYKEQGKKIMEDANAALAKEKAALIGKALPVEFDEAIGFAISDCKITDVKNYTQPTTNPLTLSFTYKVKATDADALKNLSALDYPIAYTFVDVSGNVLDEKARQPISFGNDRLKQLRNGETVEKEGWFVLEPSFANFAKIKFEKNQY